MMNQIAAIVPHTIAPKLLEPTPTTADEAEEVDLVSEALLVDVEVPLESIESDVPKMLR